MVNLDIETIRTQIRAMDYVHGSPADIAGWRMAHEDSRANLVIEDMIPTPNDDAFFDMLLGEGVAPPLVSQILLRLLDHPDADRSMPITPMMAAESR